MNTLPPRLKAGERLRLDPEGPVYTVKRVNACAAYLTRKVERDIEVTDSKTGLVKVVKVSSTRTEAVSPYAFVYRVGEGES